MSNAASPQSRLFASPLARRLARENELPLTAVTPTGPGGRIIKRDVEAALSQGAAAPLNQPPRATLPDPRLFFNETEYEVEPLSPMMSAIAERLQQSTQEMPHYQVSMDVTVDAAESLRAKLNKTLAEQETGEKLTLNDFIVRAAALSLMDVPEINTGFAADALIRFKNADISVAVALPGGGLITPIVKAAQDKSVREIALEIRDLAKRAADMRLKPDEYEGGTFSVSNLGMFGVSEFNAIINPPQAAILAIGASRPVVVLQDGAPVETKVMRVTLSSDHRAINGAQAAEFLGVFRTYLEQPMELLF
ncbi:MAG: dihydrolipoamide acetyltransferase family protein [Parvibaculales bacterium]